MPSRQYTNNAVLQTICILQLLLGYETILPALMYRTDTKKASIEPRQSTVSPCHLISTVQSPSVPVLPHQSLSSPVSPCHPRQSPVVPRRQPSVSTRGDERRWRRSSGRVLPTIGHRRRARDASDAREAFTTRAGYVSRGARRPH